MRNPNRGAGLLFEHFAIVEQMSLRHREPARVRLQRELGPDLSQLLLRALARETDQAASGDRPPEPSRSLQPIPVGSARPTADPLGNSALGQPPERLVCRSDG